jgi:phosphatidylglycerophosphate synthase
MPLPFNKNLSVDNIIYNNYFDNKYCHLHPNEITILGFLFTVFTGYFFYTEKSLSAFLIMAVMRSLCDIYDGIIARKCNKMSKNGKLLDLTSDFLYVMMILVISLYKISGKNFILKLLISFIIIITPIAYIKIETSNYSFMENNKILKFVHDNTIIVVPLLSVFFYYLTLRFK